MGHEWDRLVDEFFFVSSLADPQLETLGCETHHAKPWCCDQCPSKPRFPTQKALQLHQRISHGLRCEARRFVAGQDCPVCGIRFATRLRCIAHLSDKRRIKCSSQLNRLSPLPDEVVAQLDEEARLARAEARKKGHTVPRAGGQARQANGRPVGRPKL